MNNDAAMNNHNDPDELYFYIGGHLTRRSKSAASLATTCLIMFALSGCGSESIEGVSFASDSGDGVLLEQPALLDSASPDVKMKKTPVVSKRQSEENDFEPIEMSRDVTTAEGTQTRIFDTDSLGLVNGQSYEIKVEWMYQNNEANINRSEDIPLGEALYMIMVGENGVITTAEDGKPDLNISGVLYDFDEDNLSNLAEINSAYRPDGTMDLTSVSDNMLPGINGSEAKYIIEYVEEPILFDQSIGKRWGTEESLELMPENSIGTVSWSAVQNGEELYVQVAGLVEEYEAYNLLIYNDGNLPDALRMPIRDLSDLSFSDELTAAGQIKARYLVSESRLDYRLKYDSSTPPDTLRIELKNVEETDVSAWDDKVYLEAAPLAALVPTLGNIKTASSGNDLVDQVGGYAECDTPLDLEITAVNASENTHNIIWSISPVPGPGPTYFTNQSDTDVGNSIESTVKGSVFSVADEETYTVEVKLFSLENPDVEIDIKRQAITINNNIPDNNSGCTSG